MSPADAAHLRARVIVAHVKDPDLLLSEIAARLGCGLRFAQRVVREWKQLNAGQPESP
jgi:transposase